MHVLIYAHTYIYSYMYFYAHTHTLNTNLGQISPFENSKGKVRIYEVIIMETQLSLSWKCQNHKNFLAFETMTNADFMQTSGFHS